MGKRATRSAPWPHSSNRKAGPLRLDLENGTLDVELGTGFAATSDAERLGSLIAAFLDGILTTREVIEGRMRMKKMETPRRFRLDLPPGT